MTSTQVCVVGAGASGLCSTRHLAAAGRTIQVFEMSPRLGGTWLYSDIVDGHSSMYYNLRTNFPKEVLPFVNFPFKEEGDSFVRHTEVLNYLEEFARHFDLYKHIKFNTQVENIKPIRSEEGGLKWKVTTKDLTNDTRQVQEFDAVMVCNGHYTKPYMPNIPGLDTFKGTIIHSHNYRKPEMFAGLTVMIVGASFSGVDIAMDLHSHAFEVLLSHRVPPPIDCEMPDNVKRVRYVHSATEDSFILEDGSESKVDAVIFCTGYLYDFPFLDPACNVTVKEGRVTPLYKHFIHIETPSLVFIGLLSKALPFTMFDLQVQFFVRLLEGEVSLPSEEEMVKDSDDDFQARLCLKMPPRQAHQMGRRQWGYFDYLSSTAKVTGVKPAFKNLYTHTEESMESDFVRYKTHNYKLVDDENYVCTN